MPVHTTGRSESRLRSGDACCSPAISAALARANTPNQPSYAGPLPAGQVTAAHTTTASPSGRQPHRPGAPRPAEVEHGGEGGADQDLPGAGRRRPVRGVGTPDRGDDRRGGDGDDGDHADRPGDGARRPEHAEQADDGQRPQPVELLLDRQRPVVLERRHPAERRVGEVGVAVAAPQLHPVRHLEQRTQQVATQRRELVERAGRRRDRDRRRGRRGSPAATASYAGRRTDRARSCPCGRAPPATAT